MANSKLFSTAPERADPAPDSDATGAGLVIGTPDATGADAARGGSRASDDDLLAAKLVPLRRPGRWASAVVALVLLAMLVHTIVENPHFQWHIVGHYFFFGSIMQGLWRTIWLTVVVMVCGYTIGIGLAAMRLSKNPILQSISFGYVWLFRSVPQLVQLLFWYEIASLYPRLAVGIPFGPHFADVKTAHLFSGIFAAFIALTLDVGAFSAEIVRGGILAVDHGQSEAAQSLGLGPFRIFRRIVLPQAMPAIIPASGNLLIGMLKATSLVSVIAVTDLLYSTQLIYNENYLIIPLLLVATIWYIILTTVLSIGQYYVERHYARGTTRNSGPGFWDVTRSNIPLFGSRLQFGSGLS